MKLNYKKLGDYITLTDERNKNLKITNLQGVSINKEFIPSIANIIGTDLSSYKIVRKGQFAYGPVTSRNGDKISVALLNGDDCIISSSYTSFEITSSELLPEYLMLWFRRPEFDRYARFMSNGSAREIFDWNNMCNVMLPVPSLQEQEKIVHDYKVVVDRIELLKKINEDLDLIIKKYFVKNIESRYKTKLSNGEWEEAFLNKICNIVYGKSLLTTELTEFGYDVFGSNGKIGFYSKFLYKNRMVIISCRGASSGKVMRTCPNSYVTSNALILENNENHISFNYLLYSMLRIDLTSKISGSAQPQLTIENLNDVKIIIPDLETLYQFEKISCPILNQIYNNENEIDELIKLKELIISNLTKEV